MHLSHLLLSRSTSNVLICVLLKFNAFAFIKNLMKYIYKTKAIYKSFRFFKFDKIKNFIYNCLHWVIWEKECFLPMSFSTLVIILGFRALVLLGNIRWSVKNFRQSRKKSFLLLQREKQKIRQCLGWHIVSSWLWLRACLNLLSYLVVGRKFWFLDRLWRNQIWWTCKSTSILGLQTTASVLLYRFIFFIQFSSTFGGFWWFRMGIRWAKYCYFGGSWRW